MLSAALWLQVSTVRAAVSLPWPSCLVRNRCFLLPTYSLQELRENTVITDAGSIEQPIETVRRHWVWWEIRSQFTQRHQRYGWISHRSVGRAAVLRKQVRRVVHMNIIRTHPQVFVYWFTSEQIQNSVPSLTSSPSCILANLLVQVCSWDVTNAAKHFQELQMKITMEG